MANKETDFERATTPRDSDPSMGADDSVEQVRGTADEEGDDLDELDEDEEMDEDEEDEGTF